MITRASGMVTFGRSRLAAGMALVCAVFLFSGSLSGGPSMPQVMTSEERIHLLSRLADGYPWFAKQKGEIIAVCERRMDQADDEVWDTMPGQCIPRSNSVNREHGCPNCGVAIHRGYGYYPWGASTAHPWKVRCPKCRERFPKNDFAAYYKSGLDERAVFDHARANKGLLINEEHPDPKDPLHTFGVDPGAGYRDEKGRIYAFVACYNGKAYWGQPWGKQDITNRALNFAHGYALTGDVRYARKAAVILSRVAVLYPEMDYYAWNRNAEYNPSGKRIPGKILDRIWDNFLVKRLLKTYDLVHDAVVNDPEFMTFLARRTTHLSLDTDRHGDRFTALIEELYFKEIFRCAQNGFLWGNTGMTEENIAIMASVTRDTAFREQLVQWLFSPRTITGYNSEEHRQLGGGLLDLVLKLTRDGFSWESGGYCEILPKTLATIYPAMSRLAGATASPVQQAVMELCRKRLSAFYRNHYTLTCLDRFKPYWGDNGTFCDPMYRRGLAPNLYFNGFLMFGDPTSAQHVKSILATSGKERSSALLLDDLHLLPPDIMAKLDDLSGDGSWLPEESVNLTGRGVVVLKQGTGENRRALWTHYGNSHTCHNHPDTFSLGLFAFGRDILPNLGYPDLKERHQFTNWHLSAISSNTVVVDGQEHMRNLEIADQKLLAESKLISLFDISADSLYEQASRYRRCVGLVNVADDAFYVVDFFDVAGGREHVYSFHSGEGDVVTESQMTFARQTTGTYAGPEVPYAQEDYHYSEAYDCRWGNGFHYLYDVTRSGPLDAATFTWNLKNTHGISPFGDDVRCRLNLLSPVTEAAIAKGKPPQNTKGNPDYIHYILARRNAEEKLTSHFVGVIEAYVAGKRPAVSVRRLKKLTGGPFSSAVEVTLADGRRDLIVKGQDESAEATFENGLRMKGFFCLLRLGADGNVLEYHASMAREVSIEGGFRKSFVPSARSRVAGFEEGVAERSTVVLTDPVVVPEGAVTPLWVDITPTAERIDGSYRVVHISTRRGQSTLYLDADSFIAGPKDKSVFGKKTCAEAFEYAFAKGASVTIPFSYHGR